MLGLIIALVLFGVIFGMGAIMFLVCGSDKKHKVIGALVCVVLWLVCSFGVWGSTMFDTDGCNNDRCECGEQAHYEM